MARAWRVSVVRKLVLVGGRYVILPSTTVLSGVQGLQMYPRHSVVKEISVNIKCCALTRNR